MQSMQTPRSITRRHLESLPSACAPRDSNGGTPCAAPTSTRSPSFSTSVESKDLRDGAVVGLEVFLDILRVRVDVLRIARWQLDGTVLGDLQLIEVD